MPCMPGEPFAPKGIQWKNMRQDVASTEVYYPHDIVGVFHRHDDAIRSRTGKKPVYINSQIGNSCQIKHWPEVYPPLTKSSKLASELIAATGLVCLRTAVLAGHPGHSRVTIGGIADRDSKCHRIWFQSQKAAERVIAELHRTHGMRRGADMVIEAVPDDADRMLRASARLLGIAVMDDEQIDILTARLAQRAESAIKALGQGTFKRLRRVTDADLTGLLARQA